MEATWPDRSFTCQAYAWALDPERDRTCDYVVLINDQTRPKPGSTAAVRRVVDAGPASAEERRLFESRDESPNRVNIMTDPNVDGQEVQRLVGSDEFAHLMDRRFISRYYDTAPGGDGSLARMGFNMNVTPEDLVKAAEDAYNALDVEQVLRLFTSDAVFVMNGKPKAKGLEELRQFHERLFAAVIDYRLRNPLRARPRTSSPWSSKRPS